MDINQEIIEMSSEIGLINEFCLFVSTFFNLTNCTYPQCSLRIFNERLKQAVVESNNKYEDARNFFMQTCIQNPELFKSIHGVYKQDNIEEIASLLPLICMENYPIEECICRICLFYFFELILYELLAGTLL